MINTFKSIKTRLLSESIRQGLPHISTMSHEQLTNLTKGGRVHLHHVTEKTDGSTFMIGHDKEGFYTQSSGSGSERMRTPQDYLDRVTKRSKETGKEPDYTGAKAFAEAHHSLQKNQKLVSHLRSHAENQGGETQLRGELFSRSLARPSEDKEGEVKLVGTSYNPSSWGSKGKIVIHSRLPENKSHDIEHFKKNLSNDEVNFDDDIIEHKPTHVDVSHHMKALSGINHELLKARTTNSNRAAKQAEQTKLATVAKSISDEVDSHVKKMSIQPKFGSGTEGAVVHPSPSNPNAPRFKITSDTFKAYKADPTNKEKFKKRTLNQIKESFLAEGGNVKVKTDKGEVSAGAFTVANRSQQRSDVHRALSDIHDAFHQEHGEHLFGEKKKGLSAGSIYGGSTKHFMSPKISDDEFKKHKSTVGDLDVQVTPEHKEKLTSTLKPGRRFGPYTVVGTKKHGKENSAVMRHDNGEHHQFDFEGTDYEKGEPTKAAQFLTSSHWDDTKAGIKGAHHKILLNAAGGSTHKFSIMNGLRSRTDESDVGTKEPEKISSTLFGKKADHSKIHSFLGVSELIKKHIPAERHQEIYDKFKSGLKTVKADHGPALSHLRKTLGVKDSLDESVKGGDHHTSVIPMVGFSPISHMGHAADLGASLSRLPGTKHVGISSKADVFSPEERKGILSRQWGEGQHQVHVVKGAGETIRRAYDSLPEGRKHLHILVGHDRRDFAEGMKSSLESGKIKEMEDKKFDSISLHYPEDTDRSHGMSGTKMRKAASEGNVDEVHRHLGKSFSRKEATSIAKRMKDAIDSGKLKLVREQLNIGLTFARKEMPQLGASRSFIEYMNKNGIESVRRKIDPSQLKSSQMEFDRSKIEGLKEKPSSNPIIVSNDGHVVDGHHRWLADSEMGRKCDAYVVDMPILDLLHKAKHYTAMELKEEINRKELAPMLDSFVSFASNKLGLKSMPAVRYKGKDDDYNSFAAYNPSSNELSVSTLNRHPMDIFRSVAHELVHHKQNEDGRIGKDVAKEGETGSDIENEANAEAGKIMRWFAKANPDMFSKSYVVENNTAAIGGGVRGLGNVTGEVSPTNVSQYVLDNLAHTNSTDGLWVDDGVKSYWLDKKGSVEYKGKTTKGFKALRENLNEGINDPGKLKAVFLAGGPGSGKDFVMNKALAGNGLREINSDTAFEFLMKRHGLDLEMPDEERVEREIVRGRAKGMTSKKEVNSLAGRLGLIVNGTADDLEKIRRVKSELEDLGYDTMMVFVNTSNEVSRQRNVERGKSGNRKVPDGTDKQGVPDDSPNIRQEKWDLAQKNLPELEKIFGKDKFAVIDNTADLRKVTPEEKNRIEGEFSRIRRMTMQFVQSPIQNKRGRDWTKRRARYQGTTQYQPPKAYTKPQAPARVETPKAIVKPSSDIMNQARRLGLSYYGFGRFGRKVNGINKVLYHSKGNQLVKVQSINEDLRKWFREKWVRFDTKGNIKGDCAREPGEGKPKCRPLASARAMSKEERAKSARRKRREDPVANRPGKGGKPINVQTEQVLLEKNKPTNPALWARAKSLAKSKFDVYPSAYANGWASKWYKSKGGGWKSVSEEVQSEACWTGYKQEGMKTKNGRNVPNCVPVSESKKTHKMVMTKKGKVKRPLAEIDKKFEKMTEDELPLKMGYGLPVADGVGPTTTQYRQMAALGFGASLPLSESILSWVRSEKTHQKFYQKYGDLWEEKLIDTALMLEESGCGCEHSGKKSIKRLKESWPSAPYKSTLGDMSPIGIQNKDDDVTEASKEDIINTSKIKSLKAYKKNIHPESEVEKESLKESTPAWQRSAGKDPEGGLNRKGIESYRRENPGSKLSMAVTTPPSKLKKGSKKAKRRLSFCRRMKGMKKKLTSAKTARDPNSRINKSLRKWNCEE